MWRPLYLCLIKDHGRKFFPKLSYNSSAMENRIIEKTIEINAAPAKVWRVFTDPAVTKQMGGEYVTDWKAGSTFGWKGRDGKMHTSGIILDLEPEKLLKHNLSDMNDPGTLLSTITYE